MKTRISLSHSRRNLNVLIACLLSFSLFTMPFVPMAAAMSRSDSQASSLRRDKSQGQRPVKATVGVNAPVAAPIDWNELDDFEKASAFTISDAAALLKRSEGKLLRGWGVAEQSLPDV